MRREPDGHRNEASVSVSERDVPEAVGGVGQTMQEDDRPDRITLRVEDIGPVPVLDEMSRVNGTALEIAVVRDTVLVRQSLGDFGS